MITTPAEYYRELHLIQNYNAPTIALFANVDNTYKIDVNSRTIESPEFLSVLKDHKAENVYFEIDRFCDYMDLSTCACIVQYMVGEEGNEICGLYPVPFYDITTPNTGSLNRDKMLVPWCLDGRATSVAGPITYSLCFYKLDADGQTFIYNMNTAPAESKILYGLDVTSDDRLSVELAIEENYFKALLERITAVENKTFDLYWIDLY